MGEAWDVTSIAAQYVNNNGLDYCFEFELADSILNGLNSGSASDLANQMIDVVSSYPFLQWGNILGNHDTNRIMSQFNNDMAKTKAATTLLFTLPGIPYIYYGDEIGMTGIKPDENLRTPMQWTGEAKAGFTTGNPWRAINSDYTTKNVAAQQADAGSLWHHYHSLITLRNTEDALSKGTYLPVATSNSSVLAFVRQFENENILVVENLGNSATNDLTVTLNNGGIAPGEVFLLDLLGAGTLEMTVNSNGGFTDYEMPSIPAKGYRIYKIMSILGTDTTPQSTGLALYPNPSATAFSLTTDVQTVQVYNLAGQLVQNYASAQAGKAFDVSALAKGMYLVKVTDTAGKLSTIKLVKE